MAKKRVCVIGAGPCGMTALWNFAKLESDNQVDVVCYEKQKTWGGLWTYSWRTGTDGYGEPCHSGMYRHLWSNGPKECLEFPDYTFEKHFGKAIPSFPPRPVLRDYLEGRWTNNVNLKPYIRFSTVVRHVEYNERDKKFTVDITNLETDTSLKESFDYVIVATGIFNVPNIPDFPGLDTFEGRILHSHDFRDAKEFKDQRLLVVGSSYSAEDLALQCMKYGAKSAICTWRTKPMGFKWPKGIEERPLVQKFDGNIAHFKDGSSAEIDAVLLCTGYKYSFPFMEDNLRLRSTLTMFPDNTYKGLLYFMGEDSRLFYMGLQDQYYSYTMFDVEALWICKYILGKLPNEPRPLSEMKENSKEWYEKRSKLKTAHDDIDFQTAYIADLCKDTGYNPDVTKAGEMFHTWENDKDKNIATYRDQCFTSIFTGTRSPAHTAPWWQAKDDSIKAFVNKK
ncbi:trimethylamine monooxygenase-like [Ruditapes philippinarum]|uniref:trimethylamine monooxygenase-like n=1 Tax=Ruditapes philippinarum TaxID=129788 RepID=UPI00295B7E07|nr:trimethylamine monooxygenase-like [Ruditapes philippinarum]